MQPTSNDDARTGCLILTIGSDSHALSVAAVLSRLGVPVDVLSLASIPGTEHSIDIDADGVDLRLGEAHYDLGARAPVSVWNRRSAPTFHLPVDAHPADHGFVKGNVRDFAQALQVVFSDSAFLVNPLEGKAVTSNKVNQLRGACAVGLTIPRTSISSDLAHVREVFRGRRVCMKPFKIGSWRSDDGYFTSMTTVLDDLQSLDRSSTALMPSIFQEYIEKHFEVRLTLFGGYVCGTRINNQQSGDAAVDWRIDHQYLGALEPISPPASILEKSRALLKRLGLRFGTFDFCVRPNGEWVFLEVNEAGQFLWQEEYCSDNRVLEPFARYLAAGDDGFVWDASKASPELSLAAIKAGPVDEKIRTYLYREPAMPDAAMGVSDERKAMSSIA